MMLLILLIALNSCLAELPRIYPNYTTHPCKRKCDGKKMVCHYKLHMENMFTLEENCLQCLEGNPKDCSNPACIVADGKRKLINTYNRMIPGPSIEVCQNDEIMVDLTNDMYDVGTTIHWHGVHQMKTQWMDGVPFVTQCPIHGGNEFRYHFKASEIGTHFYHSHDGFQLGDGAYGPLIIRQPIESDPHHKLYDYDLSEHIMVVTDWYVNISRFHYFDLFSKRRFDFDAIGSVLTNGVGATNDNGVTPNKFIVEKGKRYRFRVINSASEACSHSITIEGHQITVISSDGFNIQPLTVDTLNLLSGERYDFILDANQSPGSYAIQLLGGVACINHTTYSILQYKGTTDTQVDFDSAEFPDENGLGINCINQYNNKNCYNYVNMTSLEHIESRLKSTPTHKYYIVLDINFYVRPNLRGVNDSQLAEPFINNISNIQPSSPLLLNPHDKNNRFCNSDNLKEAVCNGPYCSCNHLYAVPLKSVIELIFVDEAKVFSLTHPMHLHGHSFRVLGVQKLGEHTTIDYVKQLDREGKLIRNFNDPPVKDTVSVPSGGYTIVRFYADNPGYWALHCHIDFHMNDGMLLVIKVGSTPPVPKNFPNCGNYLRSNRI